MSEHHDADGSNCNCDVRHVLMCIHTIVEMAMSLGAHVEKG